MPMTLATTTTHTAIMEMFSLPLMEATLSHPAETHLSTLSFGVTYSDGVYADSKTGLNPRREREIGERSRDSSSDSSNKSPSRMAEKDKRRD